MQAYGRTTPRWWGRLGQGGHRPHPTAAGEALDAPLRAFIRLLLPRGASGEAWLQAALRCMPQDVDRRILHGVPTPSAFGHVYRFVCRTLGDANAATGPAEGGRLPVEVAAVSGAAAAVTPAHDRLLSALERLPLHQRAIIGLCWLYGLSYDAAAEVVGTTSRTVRAQMLDARTTLRTLLADDEGGSPTGP